jgi:tight adherence protein B
MIAAAGVVLTLVLVRWAARATSRQGGMTRLRAPASRRRAAPRPPASGLAAALDDVGRGLRAGCSLVQAVETAAGRADGVAAQRLDGLVVATARGVPLEQAAMAWGADAPTADERLAAVALSLAAAGGTEPGRAVDGVAATLRERAALAAEVRAQSAQARLSALVIAVLPLAFAAWCLVADPRSAAFLVTTPAGWACAAVGLALEALGVWWMARILREVR